MDITHILRSQLGKAQYVALNVPLLCATVGMASAVMIAYTGATMPLFFFDAVLVLLSLFVLVALCYAGWLMITTWQEPDKRHSLGISAMVSSMLLVLIAIAFSALLSYASPLRIASAMIYLTATLVLLWGISRGAVEGADKVAPVPMQLLLPPGSPASPPVHPPESPMLQVNDPSVKGNTPQSLPVVDPRTIPHLFVQDELYRLPQNRHSRFFYVTKDGEHQVDSEDACVASDDGTLFALCDGASGSSIPRPWAALLGRRWLKQRLYAQRIDAKMLKEWLEVPRLDWEIWMKHVWWTSVNARNRQTGDHPVPLWQLDEILSRGAYSTFLGVGLDRRQKRWYATAIGDTCLFHIRRTGETTWHMRTKLPLTTSTDFTDRTPLLATRVDSPLDKILPYIRCYEDSYQQGDMLLLATDALAQWFIMQEEKGLGEWQTLLNVLYNQEIFERFVVHMQERGLMKEDDTTLLIIPL